MDASYFSALDDPSRALMLKRALNYEQLGVKTLYIDVKVTDAPVGDTIGDPLSHEVQLEIEVYDVNDAPTFGRPSNFFVVREDDPAGTVVGSVDVADEDRTADGGSKDTLSVTVEGRHAEYFTATAVVAEQVGSATVQSSELILEKGPNFLP